MTTMSAASMISLSTEFKQSISPSSLRTYLAEFIATFYFVLAAVGSSMAAYKMAPDPSLDPSSLILTAIAQGFAFAAVIYISSAASAGHTNPAITFGLAIGGHITLTTATMFWITQLLASTGACLFLHLVTGVSVPTTEIAADMTGFGAALLEGVATFGLVYTIYAAGELGKGEHGVIGPIASGFVLAGNVLATGPFSGGSMNPARSFGTAIVSGQFRNHAVYWLGPLIGAGFAAIVFQNVVFPSAAKPSTASGLVTDIDNLI